MIPVTPKQGEIWIVNFDPTQGSEVRKKRPALVISADDVGVLPLRIVVPITNWSAEYDNRPWMVLLLPDEETGLRKASAADSFQVKSVSTERFVSRLGAVSAREFIKVVRSILVCIEPDEHLIP